MNLYTISAKSAFTLIVLSMIAIAISGCNKLHFSPLLAPENVTVDSNRSLLFCLVNRGSAGTLEGSDHLELTIPLGPAGSDLEADASTIGCGPSSPGWFCNLAAAEDSVSLTVGPSGPDVPVAADETVCFDVTNLQVNLEQGMTFSELAQSVHFSRAKPPLTDLVPVFKSKNGLVLHDDLAGVEPAQHHERYSDQEAFQAVLERDGTGSQLDADTLDGMNSTDFLVVDDDNVIQGNLAVDGKVSSSAFTSNSPLIFEAPIDVERARIDDISGNFGIGTEFPSARLHVRGDVIIQNGELACFSDLGQKISCIDESNVLFGIVPIGSIIAWHPNLPGVPELPNTWAKCNGQVITEQNHPGSPLVNTTLPDLNGEDRFLRGGFTSGELQDEEVGRHSHRIDTFSSGINGNHVNRGSSGNVHGQAATNLGSGTENRPVNMSVVWIMRVK